MLAIVAQAAPSTVVQAAHTGSILAVSASHLGGRAVIASGGHDGTIAIHDGDLRPLHLVPAFGGAIFSLTTHALPDGVLLAAGTHSRVVRLYKLADDAEPLELWTSRQHTGWVRALTFATRRSAATRPDRLVSIGCNRLLSWGLDASNDDAREPEIEHALYEDEICVRSHDIFSLAHGGAAEALAAGSVDGALRRWSTAGEAGVAASLRDRTPLHWDSGHGRVSGVAFLRTGLVSAGYDGRIRRWTDEAAVAAEADAGRGSRVLSLSADGDTVYCATAAGEVVRFDDELREHERTVLPATDAGDVRATAVAAIDGGGCVCGDSAGRLHRMD